MLQVLFGDDQLSLPALCGANTRSKADFLILFGGMRRNNMADCPNRGCHLPGEQDAAVVEQPALLLKICWLRCTDDIPAEQGHSITQAQRKVGNAMHTSNAVLTSKCSSRHQCTNYGHYIVAKLATFHLLSVGCETTLFLGCG